MKRNSFQDRKKHPWKIAGFFIFLVFSGSIFLGRWFGNKLLGSHGVVQSPKNLYPTSTVSPFPGPASSPLFNRQTQEKRENIEPPSLVVPPPVIEPETSPGTNPSGNENLQAGLEKEKTPSSAPPILQEEYKVQAGLFLHRDAAEDFAKRLTQEGYESRIEPAAQGGETGFRVFLGPFSSREAADSTVQKLHDSGYSSFLVKIK